jgi:hypothetical protein
MLNREGRLTRADETKESGSETFSGNRGLAIEEPLIFEIGRADTTGVDLDESEKFTPCLGNLGRTEPLGLPGLSEPEAMRHYVRLSQKNYGIDTGIFPLGSCTMKHNPRLNEKMVRLAGFADIHPLQPLSTVPGAVELIGELARWLLTLTGMGGGGKTRLALASVDERAAFVPLAPVADPALVATAVAQALGVQEVAGQPLERTLGAHLRDRELLLCIDNFEHLLEAAPLVSELLACAPGLRVLATSRAPLRLLGEQEYPVPSLEAGEAVSLFELRARQARPDFALADGDRAVVQIGSGSYRFTIKSQND